MGVGEWVGSVGSAGWKGSGCSGDQGEAAAAGKSSGNVAVLWSSVASMKRCPFGVVNGTLLRGAGVGKWERVVDCVFAHRGGWTVTFLREGAGLLGWELAASRSCIC